MISAMRLETQFAVLNSVTGISERIPDAGATVFDKNGVSTRLAYSIQRPAVSTSSVRCQATQSGARKQGIVVAHRGVVLWGPHAKV